MAGSPLKRARKAGVTGPGTGELIPFRYAPRVAELPRGWRRWSPAAKIEHALNMSLDGVAEVLYWPPGELDPHPLNVWAQVVRVAWMIGAKARVETRRERQTRRLVTELGRRLSEKNPEPPA
jgi:hypothetical protein